MPDAATDSMTRRLLALVVGAVVVASTTGCGTSPGADDAANGSGSLADQTTVKNTRIAPLFVPGSCSLQVGRTADLRFTVTNNRASEEERLLGISTDAADLVRTSPADVLVIPPGTTISAGRPVAQFDPESNREPLEVKLVGIDPDVRPGTTREVIFQFAEAGDMSVRAPVEPCPAQP